MFQKLFQNFSALFPYKTSKGNNINIYVDNKKVKLARKIKGLKVIFNKNACGNTLDLYLPLSFKDTTIIFTGSKSKITIKSTKNTIDCAYLHCAAWGEIFINEDSRITMPNLVLRANNNTKENPSKIVIGKSVQIGKDVIIRTSDGHSIFNLEDKLPYNAPQDVIIGDNVWIGERSVILKGSTIPNNSIVGSCSIVCKKFEEENVILAGVPAKIVKRNIKWTRKPYGAFVRSFYKNPERLKNEKKVLIKKIKRKFLRIKFLSNF